MSGNVRASGTKAALAGTTISIELPENIAAMLQEEARLRKKPVAALILEWLENQADEREAAKRLRRIDEGTVTPLPAAQVYERLGL